MNHAQNLRALSQLLNADDRPMRAYDCEAAADELDRLQAIVADDTRRLGWLAGCESDDGPIVEGFAMLLDDFWCFLGDAIRERIGEENDSPDIEETDDDKLTAFRAMVDEAMAIEKARKQ